MRGPEQRVVIADCTLMVLRGDYTGGEVVGRGRILPEARNVLVLRKVEVLSKITPSRWENTLLAHNAIACQEFTTLNTTTLLCFFFN